MWYRRCTQDIQPATANRSISKNHSGFVVGEAGGVAPKKITGPAGPAGPVEPGGPVKPGGPGTVLVDPLDPLLPVVLSSRVIRVALGCRHAQPSSPPTAAYCRHRSRWKKNPVMLSYQRIIGAWTTGGAGPLEHSGTRLIETSGPGAVITHATPIHSYTQ